MRIISLVFLCSVFLQNGAASGQGLQEKILGGYPCRRLTQPWQASLNLGYHACGGALLNSHWVISVAHCWFNPSRILVVLGEFDLSEHEGTEQPRRVSTALWHPLYDLRTRSHDVMLLRLAEPVLFTPYVRPVPLPVNCPATGTYCTVSGWGNTAGDGFVMPNKLRCAEAVIVSEPDCEAAYPGMTPGTVLCAGNSNMGTSGPCQGDFGGALVCDGVIHGIASWSEVCAHSEGARPTVYTKLCALLPWIQSTLTAD
ncbi:trypsin-like [Huso huso]|uniref:Trypsin-like n=1 Tax=Huso huso TaxID=61971 RepID=A0ABR0YB17_HUSHU